MNELPIAPHPQDIYLFNLLELLRTKYFDASVNRGSETFSFFYRKRIKGKLHKLSIPGTEMMAHYLKGSTPIQILKLVEPKQK